MTTPPPPANPPLTPDTVAAALPPAPEPPPAGRLDTLRERAPLALAALLGGIGSLHFVVPGMMARTVPRWVPAKKAVIYASGVVEVGCAVGLVRRERWAGPVAAACLAAIWPANIQMALDAGTGRNAGPADNRALMWARVPMQLPMIWAALQSRPREDG